MASNLIDLLKSTTIGSLMKMKHQQDRTEERPIIKAHSETSVSEALQLLESSHILSIPVWDKLDGTWLGFLDCADIVSFVIKTLKAGKESMGPEDWNELNINYRDLMHCELTFSLLPIKKVINASRKDLFIPVYSHGTIYQLMEDVFYRGIHRAPIFDEVSPHKILDVISQSDVINYLGHHLDFLDKLGDKTVEELNLGTRGVIVTPINFPAIHAFYVMDNYKVSAVAVIDPANGVLLANLSLTDIRGLWDHRFSSLLRPIHQFYLASKGTIIPPVTCSLNTSLSTVITKIVYFRIHRLWITDGAGKPVGIISLSDVMQVLSDLPDEIGEEKKVEEPVRVAKDISPLQSSPTTTTVV